MEATAAAAAPFSASIVEKALEDSQTGVYPLYEENLKVSRCDVAEPRHPRVSCTPLVELR